MEKLTWRKRVLPSPHVSSSSTLYYFLFAYLVAEKEPNPKVFNYLRYMTPSLITLIRQSLEYAGLYSYLTPPSLSSFLFIIFSQDSLDFRQ
jgi:hypothetical protein